MPASRPNSSLVLLFVALLVAAGCANDSTTGEPGSLNVNLELRGDITINQVAWEVRGNGITPISGAINTSAIGSTPSVEVFGIPSGSNYLITMTATSLDGATSCEGWAEFDVSPQVTTNVMVMLNCKPAQNLGGVRVNGKFNFCADLVRVVVAPLQTSVGNDIALSAGAVDLEGDEILYRWEATDGFIDDPTAPETTYTCRTAGSHAVRVEVSDDSFDYCISDWTVAITCVSGDAPECELDADCDAGEVCEQNVCVPDVECNVDADCDAGEICLVNVCVPDVECNVDQDCGAGDVCFQNECIPDLECSVDGDCAPGEVCEGNVCIPDLECRVDADCATGEICVGNVCVPDVECNIDQDCPAGEICFANECVPDLECNIDQDCPLGEVCVANDCVPNIECNLDADCDAGEVCVDNLCVLDVGCSSDQDCVDANECTVGTCNVGTGLCTNSDVQDGTVCDDGNGLCAVGECRTNELLGTDFVIVFEANYLASQLTLGLSGPQASTGVVSIPALGFSQSFVVTPGEVTTLALPPLAEVTSSDVVEPGAAVRVVSEEQITVYGLNRLLLSTDAFAALPVEVLGQRHRIAAWSGGINGPSQLAVAAVPAFEGDTTTPTTVTITPAAAAGARPAGIPFTVVLRPLDAYQLQSEGDLTGSLVESDRPISVFGGNRCANIPDQETGFCDHVVEQLPPVSIWGTEALTVPLATRTSGDTFRIMADQNGTQVQLEGATPELINLNAGDFAERNLTGSYRITASSPILVSQFSNGTQWDGVTSDPFMMLIPSAAQFIRTYTFATPGSGFPENYANIVALTSDVASGTVLLDGAPVPAGSFTALAGTPYSTAQVPISIGSHTLIAPNPLGLYVYGYAAFDSYGYPGGFSTGNGLLP
ncbi:MAG: PKD domain-containing protein [Deltaproteobacteria bacterium]|nr:PKD domain-containing protein [Deltaproteobacteria bacterium]NNK06723.1 PKD domain-containing protein [Myxococcales bacterium]